jgi:hypothetical protein
MLRYTERQNNTREQVQDYLNVARAVVEDLGIPKDLREIAFGKAVDLLASKQVVTEQVGVPVSVPGLNKG